MDLLAIAKNAADRVEAASVANKVPVAVCVINAHGSVVLQHRMNGGPVFSIELSELGRPPRPHLSECGR